MVELFANSGDTDQTPHSVMSDLGLHCLPITLSWVSDYNGLMCYNFVQVCIEFLVFAYTVRLR